MFWSKLVLPISHWNMGHNGCLICVKYFVKTKQINITLQRTQNIHLEKKRNIYYLSIKLYYYCLCVRLNAICFESKKCDIKINQKLPPWRQCRNQNIKTPWKKFVTWSTCVFLPIGHEPASNESKYIRKQVFD